VININQTDIVKQLEKYLREKYEAKGANFHFKSKRVAEKLHVSPVVVGRGLILLSKQGVVQKYSRIMWKTQYGIALQENKPKKSLLRILRNLIKK
jgi:Mn-dependent DtxR family transcriptional regulator